MARKSSGARPRDGFFIHGDKLIWLDKEGKPSSEEEMITLDPTADPKRIKFTTKGQGGKEHVLREGFTAVPPSARVKPQRTS